VLVEGERWPGFLHVIEHPDGRILVDTGLIDSTPEIDEQWSPQFDPDAIPRDVAFVVNTHLHFDHCGGNRLFAVELDGARELAPGVRVLPTPGHTPGHQSVLVDTDDGLVVVAGDVAYSWEEFDEPTNEAAAALTQLGPRRIWLAHESTPRELTA
jgi:N-acyl homoserine lactone hydrolase